jgi:Trp operon repressor
MFFKEASGLDSIKSRYKIVEELIYYTLTQKNVNALGWTNSE